MARKIKAIDSGEQHIYWTSKILEWQRSQQSQNKFCLEHGLNPNTFSTWKVKLTRTGDISPLDSSFKFGKVGRPSKPKKDSQKSQPSFLRFSAAESDRGLEVDSAGTGLHYSGSSRRAAAGARTNLPPSSGSQHFAGVAAEILDTANGCTRILRIFNGADKSTLDTLLSSISGF
jgi:hypothetical protein